MGYSLDRRLAVLKRMLPPNNVAIRQLAQEEGISEATLTSRTNLYATARAQNPQRWSGKTRNWQP